jgi:nucleoside-diphosphate-sugar epimerase
MRVFLAGATGAIGIPLVQQLVAAGHTVAGMTRSRPEAIRRLGAEPVVCDVYDLPALTEAICGFAPDRVLHELTDLPRELSQLDAALKGNERIRTEGTRNLLAAAGDARMLAQSIAFPPGAPEHEALVLAAGGVILRYGRFYGPGTWHAAKGELPPRPRIHVDEAARRTVEALDAAPGTVLEIVEG